MILFYLFFLLCTAIRPDIRVLIDLFRLFAQDHFSSFFVCSFFCAWPFDQKLGSSLIYFVYLHTTIRLKYMFPFYLYFLLYTTVRSKIKVLISLFLLFAHDHLTKLYGPISFILSFVHDHLTKGKGPLIYFFYLHTTI